MYGCFAGLYSGHCVCRDVLAAGVYVECNVACMFQKQRDEQWCLVHFSLTQPREWNRPHLGWLFLPQLPQSRNSHTLMPRCLSLAKLTVDINPPIQCSQCLLRGPNSTTGSDYTVVPIQMRELEPRDLICDRGCSQGTGALSSCCIPGVQGCVCVGSPESWTF